MIRLAIVGCGGEAHEHARVLQQIPDCRVTALVSQTPSHIEDFQRDFFPGARGYAEYDRLMEESPEDVDAVLLLTPHALHYPQAKAALEHGYHVLTEKPMVTQSDHGYDLWRLSNETGRQIGIAFQAPFSAPFQYLKRLRDAGEWGAPQIIQGWLAQDWMRQTLLTWRQDPSLSGGGQLYDSGSHVLNAMLWLMDSPVVEVACMIDNCSSPVDINGVATLRFENHALGAFAVGGNSVGWDTRVMLQTDTLDIHADAHGTMLKILGNDEYANPQLPTDPSPVAFTPHRNFINALLGREELQMTARHGVVLSVLMDALYDAAKRRTLVKVPTVPSDPVEAAEALER